MRVILAAGGTGGHIYPALAFAKYLKQNVKDVKILFVGSKHRVENTLIPSHGYDFIGLNLNTPSGNIFKKVKGYMNAFQAIDDCLEIIDDFNADVIIGFGGFTCFSMMKAGLKRNKICLLHEQNSVIGKSNKALANKVDALVCAYPSIKQQVKSNNVYVLGNPTYNECLNVEEYDLAKLGLNNDKKTILIVMGSLGSSTINKIVLDMFNDMSDDYQIIYVCGNDYYQEEDFSKLPEYIKVIPYSNELISMMNNVDLVIARAGASTLTELMALNKPSIIIPSIHVTNNHQYYNALYYEKLGCLKIIEETNLTHISLKEIIDNTINNNDELLKIEDNIKKTQDLNPCLDMLELIKEKGGNVNE